MTAASNKDGGGGRLCRGEDFKEQLEALNARGPEMEQIQQPEQALGGPSQRPAQALGGPRGWYRRFLPHRDEAGLVQFITFRLADSIPSALLDRVEDELRTVPPERMDAERRLRMEAMLDMVHGSGVLRDPRAAGCVIGNWRHHDGQRHDLVAWVVMPTHVHVMIRPLGGHSLPRIVQSWKSFTGKRLKALFPHACADGEFWKREYWDRFIRDETHFHNAVAYIHQNPVKAGLVSSPDEWPYLGPPSACSEPDQVRGEAPAIAASAAGVTPAAGRPPSP